MTKQELVHEVTAAMSPVGEYIVKEVIDAAIEVVAERLAHGEDVTLRGLGTLKVVTRAPKSVRNINTGEQFTMPATRRVKFIPGKDLKNI